jgi:cytochrome c biogenesis protein CcmG/thiol:disulfide interchange protein DsbE
VSTRTFVVFLAVLAVLGLLGYGVISKGNESLAVGEPIPDGSLPSLEAASESSLADYRGQWVLANVWASWCLPCRQESPALERFYEQNRGRDFVVVGIDSGDNTEDALAFVERYGITYPQLHDGSGDFAQNELGTTGVPESFLIDPSGRLVVHQPGPVTEDYLQANVLPLIGGRARG